MRRGHGGGVAPGDTDESVVRSTHGVGACGSVAGTADQHVAYVLWQGTAKEESGWCHGNGLRLKARGAVGVRVHCVPSLCWSAA
eukprot:5685909-Prymnesium_polylepis.1